MRACIDLVMLVAIAALTSCVGSDGAEGDIGPGGLDTLAEVAADVVEDSLVPVDGVTDRTGDDVPDADVGDDVALFPPPICTTGTLWELGIPVFEEITGAATAGAGGAEGYRVSVVDYDGDGSPDLLVRNGGGEDTFDPEGTRRKWLLRNDGTGAFIDVTKDSGILTLRLPGDPESARPGEVTAAADVDNDGDIDVFFGATVNEPIAGHETSELMINQGDGTFVLGPADSELRSPDAPQVPAGASFVDVDRDGNVDIWVTQSMVAGAQSPMNDRLYLGDGTGGFVEVTAQAGLETMDWYYVGDLNEGLARDRASPAGRGPT